MDLSNHIAVLARPLHVLGFSKNFCEKSKIMGFSNLASILAVKPAKLFTNKYFSHIWFGELTKFLVENELIDLLQPI